MARHRAPEAVRRAGAARPRPGVERVAAPDSPVRRRRTPRRRRPGAGCGGTDSTRGTTASAATVTVNDTLFHELLLGQPREQRQEDQLAGRAAGGEDSGDQALALDEPPIGDRGDEGERHRAGTEPDQHAPAQDQLPALGHEHREAAADGDEAQRTGDDRAHAEPVHQRRRERRGQPVEDQVDHDGGGDRAARPAEVVLQRLDQHARRGAEAPRSDQRDEGCGGDEPRPQRSSAGRERVGRRGVDEGGHEAAPIRRRGCRCSARTRGLAVGPGANR